MTIRTPWSTGFRLLVTIALFVLSGGTALAYQDDIKDAVQDGEEASETPGLVEEGEYVSPQFEVGITWTDAWEVGSEADPNVAHAIGGNYDGPVASDPDLGDIVFLVDTESESSVLSLGFSPSEEPVEPELLLQAMGQETFLEENLFLSDEAEVLLLEANRSTAAILAREAAPNDDHLVYLSIVADPGREDYSFWVGLDMYEPDEYEAILASIEDDIEVEDNDVFDVFGPDEILAAVESGETVATEEPAETEEATEEPVKTEAATEEPVETEEATEEPVETEEPTEEPAETEEAIETEEGIEPANLTPAATEAPLETEEATEEPVETVEPIAPLDPTEEPVETEAPAETEEATEEPVETEAATEEPAETVEASPGTGDAPGLVGEGAYVSPSHHLLVQWTHAWTLDDSVAEPVQSFPETGLDSIYLTDAATGNATVYITIEYRDEFTPRGALDALSATDYIERFLGLSAETEVVLSGTGIDTVAVVYVDDSGTEPIVVLLEANVVDDDTVAFVEVRANTADLDAELLDAVAEDLTIDGEAGLSVFTADEILDVLP